MGYELRRVPSDWEHPTINRRGRPTNKDAYEPEIGFYTWAPTYDEYWLDAIRSWWWGNLRWKVVKWLSFPFLLFGIHLPWCRDGIPKPWIFGPFEKYAGPRPNYYGPYRRRRWSEDEATHWQLYETVSEGTPLTPPCASLEEMAEWAAKQEKKIVNFDKADAWSADDWSEWLYNFRGAPESGGDA